MPESTAGPGLVLQLVARLLLAAFMVVAGVAHFASHESFLRQTPPWLPARSLIVWGTGVAEVVLGAGLLGPARVRRAAGWALAVFLVLVFPGNVYQAVAGTEAFGLRTPTSRWVRLLFQPPLVLLALWSSGAWPGRRTRG